MDVSEIAITEIEAAGLEIDQVTLQIDYEIIQHFSRHLYGSPNKAIEELVTNSFDAFAHNAYVYLRKAKLERIRRFATPTIDFDYRSLLDEIWIRQGKESKNDLVPYKHVYQSNAAWKARSFEDFQAKLVALETLAGGRILLNLDQREIVLKQEPRKIVEQVERSLALKSAPPPPVASEAASAR